MSDAAPPPVDAPTSPEELSHLAEAVDRAVAEITSLDPPLRAKALALKAAIEAFHKGGLTTIVKRLKADPRGKEILFELVDEPHVHALFSMHGIVRADITTRVARVIEMVRPYMQSHGGDVTLVEVRDQKAFVQLSGSCNGCSMSAATLRDTVEESLREHVPEIEGVEVVPSEPEATAEPAVVQIALPSIAATAAGQPVTQGAGWVAGPRVEEVTAERPMAFAAGEAKVIVVRSKEGLRAFRNACGHVGLPLDRAACDLEAGTLTCPWHGFTFDTATGGCFSSPVCRLEPFPLRESDGLVWVRPQ
jgi:Fe-S cluster biogenesis protein NfuA/nitrite reductase/ring-hydroxylating ferredoxin subunit